MGEFNDMERFYDTCEDKRTYKQIVWEEGIYKDGSLRQKWAYSFGKNGFYKFGKKIAAFLILMLLWTAFAVIIPNSVVRAVFDVASVAGVNAASVWLYRNTQEDKRLTRLNIAYIAFCVIFAAVFYKYFVFVFEYIGKAVFLSLYYGVYMITGNGAFVVRILISIAVVYCALRYNREKGNIVSIAISIISVMAGIVYRAIVGDSYGIYCAFAFMIAASACCAFLCYIKNRNRFLRNASLVFCFVSYMEMAGSFAVVTGAMDNYISNGVL